MRAPEGLTPRAREAFRRAAEALGDGAERFRAALERYARAVDRSERLNEEWAELGRPMLHHGPRGGLSAHPLLSAIRMAAKAEADLEARLGIVPGRRMPGRPVGASSAPDRRPGVIRQPTPRLRMVSHEPPRVHYTGEESE